LHKYLLIKDIVKTCTHHQLILFSYLTVAGTIAMKDYLEAGTIVFLFSIAEWLESSASHKVFVYYFSCFTLAKLLFLNY